jgi:hypothetical protein
MSVTHNSLALKISLSTHSLTITNNIETLSTLLLRQLHLPNPYSFIPEIEEPTKAKGTNRYQIVISLSLFPTTLILLCCGIISDAYQDRPASETLDQLTNPREGSLRLVS